MMTGILFLLMGTRLIYLNAEALSTTPWYTRVQADGSFLICSEKQVAHFDKDGTYIRTLTGKNLGPEAIGKVTNVIFDGHRYYLSDKANLSVTLYDKQGVFLNKQTLYCWNLLSANGKLFMVDIRALHPARESAFALTRLSLDKHNFLHEHERFYTTRKRMEAFAFEYKSHTLTALGDNYYVMDEISNELTQLSPSFAEIKTVAASLPGYVQPKPASTKEGYEARRKHMFSASFIYLIAPIDKNLAISYAIPNAANLYQRQRRVQIVDTNGKPVGKPLDTLGTLIGSYRNELFFIQEGDEYLSEITAWSR